MNKQAIEIEYKRICNKLGFIPNKFKPIIPKDISEDYGHIKTLLDYLSIDEMLILYENGYLKKINGRRTTKI